MNSAPQVLKHTQTIQKSSHWSQVLFTAKRHNKLLLYALQLINVQRQYASSAILYTADGIWQGVCNDWIFVWFVYVLTLVVLNS